jgi:glycosyltransferase involved in cell wall biosynthesis
LEDQRYRARKEQYCRATALFPWSRWCAESLVNDYGVEPSRLYIMPPGVDLDYWRCECRTGQDLVHILFVGGHFYRKGGDMLLRWAQSTSARNWRLHLVTRDDIKSDDPRIQVYRGIAPNSEALRQLYQLADLFVLPTRGDCYSLAAIEAMAAGLPVILSRTGGTPDIIDEGHTGYLIEVENEEAMAAKLEYLLAQPEQRVAMGTAARLVAEQRYNAFVNVCKTVQIMRQHLSTTSSSA